jgi:hypothetical protein
VIAQATLMSPMWLNAWLTGNALSAGELSAGRRLAALMSFTDLDVGFFASARILVT